LPSLGHRLWSVPRYTVSEWRLQREDGDHVEEKLPLGASCDQIVTRRELHGLLRAANLEIEPVATQ
jgi:hypothetical protein